MIVVDMYLYFAYHFYKDMATNEDLSEHIFNKWNSLSDGDKLHWKINSAEWAVYKYGKYNSVTFVPLPTEPVQVLSENLKFIK